MLRVALFLIVSSSSLSTFDSPITCSSNNTACDNHNDNLIETVNGVDTVEECRQLCYDDQECEYLTHYSEHSFPLQNLCLLFRSCEETHECSDCVSETRDCFFTCSDHVVGGINENLLGFLSDVESEHECRDHCSSSNNCSYYTYFTQDDPNSRTCVLLTQLLEPLQPCSTCLTGPVECEDNNNDCQMIVAGEHHSSMMFTNIGEEVNVIIPDSCKSSQLRILAVGGGGYAYLGGGGSGYIQYQIVDLAGVSNISVTVGDDQQSSVVAISDGETVVAGAGHDHEYDVGGAGFSGGSGQCYSVTPCSGGSAGGDGDDGARAGGHGTGEDITAYKFEHWDISPGAGGDGTAGCGDGSYRGAGGGGVLVDGEGPAHDQRDGEGYGGGAGWCDNQYGQQGVVLLEIVV